MPRVTFYADQGSSAIVTATFTLRGLPLTPYSLRWTLTDELGDVINLRKDVSIPSGPSVPIVLTGQDLAILSPFDNLIRILTVEGLYDSTDGAGLTLAGEFRFGINKLVGSD